jgi:hypothetical protein
MQFIPGSLIFTSESSADRLSFTLLSVMSVAPFDWSSLYTYSGILMPFFSDFYPINNLQPG